MSAVFSRSARKRFDYVYLCACDCPPIWRGMAGLRLLLPQLERVSPGVLLEVLKGNTTALPTGFVGEGRLASLGVSLKYSFDHLTGDAPPIGCWHLPCSRPWRMRACWPPFRRCQTCRPG